MPNDELYERRRWREYDESEPIPVFPLPEDQHGGFAPVEVVDDGAIEVEEVRPPQPSFWWSLLWCLGFLLVTQIPGGVLGAVILVVLAMRHNTLQELTSQQQLLKSPDFQTAMLYGFSLTEPLTIFASWLTIRLMVGKDWKRQVALRLPSVTHLLLVLLAFPALVLLANTFYAFVRIVFERYVIGADKAGTVEDAMDIFGNWPLFMAVLLVGVGPGIGEELWCRAFLGRGLVGRYGPIAGVLTTSFFFGLIHLEPRQALYAMVVGLALHFTYLTTRSLLVPMLLHFMNNSLAVIAGRIDELKFLESPEMLPPIVLGAAALLLLAVGFTLYDCRSRLTALPGLPLWRPAFPGVQCPPPGTGTVVSHPWPGLLYIGLVLISAVAFAWTMFMAWRSMQ
jgi:membrane protease YdiL (CAAX protease family)